MASEETYSGRCPIGPLQLHTMNYERDECIWCGPNALAVKPGRWVPTGPGTRAWSVGLALQEETRNG